jgi:hypothetical protein
MVIQVSTQALEFYHQALSLNPNLPQALNNIAVIYHSQALRAQSLEEDEYIELSKELIKLPNIGFKLLN